MKSITKIIGIGIIALIALVSVGAVCADESLENVGCVLTPSVAEHTYEKGILTIPINDHVDDLPNVGAWNYTPAPVPVIPDYEVRAGFNVDDWNGYTAGELPFNPGEFDPINSEPSSVWLVGSAQDTTSMEFGDI